MLRTRFGLVGQLGLDTVATVVRIAAAPASMGSSSRLRHPLGSIVIVIRAAWGTSLLALEVADTFVDFKVARSFGQLELAVRAEATRLKS